MKFFKKRLSKVWSVVSIFIVAVAAIAVYVLTRKTSHPSTTKMTSFSQVMADIQSHQVSHASIHYNQQIIQIVLKNHHILDSIFPYSFASKLEEALVATHTPFNTTAINFNPPPSTEVVILQLLPLGVIAALFLYYMGKNYGKFGKGRGKEATVPSTRFKDVAGIEEVVDELEEIVDYLHNPNKYKDLGAHPSRGILFMGSPGTGKTLLARAIAGEAGVPFFPLSGSDFVEVFAGVGPSRVRSIFTKANKAKKAIIFIDEIDAVGRTRMPGIGAASTEHENTLMQLLNEMDGFTTRSVIVIGATNRPDVLDPALTRAGRFDRKINIPKPDKLARIEIFKLFLRDKKVGVLDYDSIAGRTVGLVGADLEQLANESALEAARKGNSEITQEDVDSALATIALGREKKHSALTPRDIELVSYHEAGHALVALLSDSIPNPISVSIVPRGVSGGATWLGGDENTFFTRSQALDKLAVSMAGRAAETLILNADYSQGSSGDLANATRLAMEMVTKLGMGDTLVYLEALPISDGHIMVDVAGQVDTLISLGLTKASTILTEDRKGPNNLEKIAKALQEKEVLSQQDLLDIIR